MENKEAPAAAAVPEKVASSVPEKAAASSCFKSTLGEDASLLEQYKQFTEAQAGEHWECLKNKVSSMFAEPITFFGGGGAKDHGSSTSTSTPPSVESQ